MRNLTHVDILCCNGNCFLISHCSYPFKLGC
jgi:hypothetical protein